MPTLFRAIREHRLFLGVVGAYVAAAVAVDQLGVVPNLARTVTYVWPYLAAPTVAWVPIAATLLLDRFAVRDAQGRRVNGWRGWLAACREGTVTTERVARLLILSLTMALFLNTFGWWKGAIPILHPFEFDAVFAQLDRTLHLGRHPWEWLQPLLGTPWITRTIDILYWSWVLLVPCAILWQAWNRDLHTQRQFFLTFVLTWILLGTLLATAWSSAGPCFYERLVGDATPYGELLQYLDTALGDDRILHARATQEVLWWRHLVGGGNPWTRISAMPSIHVATTVLYALAAWRSSRVLGLLTSAYALVVLVGSVHLGWHYAIDGYVSLLLTPLLWWASGRLFEGTNLHTSKQGR